MAKAKSKITRRSDGSKSSTVRPRPALRTQMIRARVQPELKDQAESVLKEVGLSPSEAIRLFYQQVVLRQGLPFEVRIPNTETLEAIRQADTGELTHYESVADLMAKLGT